MKEKLFNPKNLIHILEAFFLGMYLIDQTLLQKTTELYIISMGILLLIEAYKTKFHLTIVTKGMGFIGIALIAYKTRGAGLKALALCLLLTALFYVIITYPIKDSINESKRQKK
ncbi:hypothetical protein KC622_02355 [Candidatus Dojkabacteria bacterium]|uniref:Uncharacterized protein n=1 Tax=Candidatus Dojkabacteria bacterium TaxID=2099670 RepID=A0A955HZ80_9BACT|nr:hypothetical protein [Candidatus Dojkabacteria bacterium]MCB9790424.1 hypothetical protein [Candidatus Nomurabacteria bacterium]